MATHYTKCQYVYLEETKLQKIRFQRLSHSTSIVSNR